MTAPSERDASGWLSTSNVSIAAGEQAQVVVEIDVPANAKLGGSYASAHLTAKPTDVADRQLDLAVSIETELLILIGPITSPRPTVELKEMETFCLWQCDSRLRLRISNPMDRHVWVRGAIEVAGGPRTGFERALVLPTEHRDYRFNVPRSGWGWRNHARVVVFTDEDLRVESEQVTLWRVPWGALALILAAMVAVIVRFHRRNRRR